MEMENWRKDAGDPVYRADYGLVVCHCKSRGRLPCRDGDGFFFVVHSSSGRIASECSVVSKF